MHIIFVLLVIFMISCQNANDENIADVCPGKDLAQPVLPVSLKEKDRIKELNGSFISVEGIFRYSFEDVAIYPSENAESKGALWLNLKIPDSIPRERLEKMMGKKVSLTGRVNMSSNGHLSAYLGSLDSVFCIKLIRK